MMVKGGRMTSVKPMSDRRCKAADHTDVPPSHGCRTGSAVAAKGAGTAAKLDDLYQHNTLV